MLLLFWHQYPSPIDHQNAEYESVGLMATGVEYLTTEEDSPKVRYTVSTPGSKSAEYRTDFRA